LVEAMAKTKPKTMQITVHQQPMPMDIFQQLFPEHIVGKYKKSKRKSKTEYEYFVYSVKIMDAAFLDPILGKNWQNVRINHKHRNNIFKSLDFLQQQNQESGSKNIEMEEDPTSFEYVRIVEKKTIKGKEVPPIRIQYDEFRFKLTIRCYICHFNWSGIELY
jgi:hypothetical protein